MLGKIKGKSWRGQQQMKCIDSITNSMGMNLSKLRDSWGQGTLGSAVHGITELERLCNWTTVKRSVTNISHRQVGPIFFCFFLSFLPLFSLTILIFVLDLSSFTFILNLNSHLNICNEGSPNPGTMCHFIPSWNICCCLDMTLLFNFYRSFFFIKIIIMGSILG